MVNIGEVIFWKAVILTGWAAFQEAREARLHDRAWQALVARFQREWDHRRAKQPLQLPKPTAGGGAFQSIIPLE